MPRFVDLSGMKFYRWTILRRFGTTSAGKVQWLCVCDCGVVGGLSAQNLMYGLTRSCGCWNSESARKRMTTHGMTDTVEFRTWQLMIDRCHNAKSKCYSRYGGRGIFVCARWRSSFADFYADMGPRPAGRTLDRKDNDGGYSPENCRWATSVQQARNMRSNRVISAFGETHVQAEWAEILGTTSSHLYHHLKHKSPEEVIRWFIPNYGAPA